MRREFLMPDVGEGLTEAEVLTWHVGPGDTVAVNQIIVEIETAKAVVELPSPFAGTVGGLLAQPGETVAVGVPIIVIDTAEVGGVDGVAADADAAPAADTPIVPAGDERGAKIGEAGADGRVATLVGYGPRPGSVTRRPRRATGGPALCGAASDGADSGPTGAGGAGAGGAGAAAVGDRSCGTGSRAPSGSGFPTADHGPEEPSDRRSGSGSGSGTATPAAGDRRFGTGGRTTSGSGFPTADHATSLGSGAPQDRGSGTGGRTPSGPGFPTADHGPEEPTDHGPGEPADRGSGSGSLVPLAKPPVRKLARDLGVDLRAVTGSGASGVVTREDVEAFAAPPAAPQPVGPALLPSTGGIRREPIRGVRRATAAAVVSSAFTAPHVTEFLAVDVTATMALRDRLRATREYAEVTLTPLAFVAKAVCLAIGRTPKVNASWDEAADEIVYYDRVQLGIAAATPRGLVVPKIRDADTLGLLALARALGELATTARSGRTSPADLAGGTFTITNVGVFGVDTGTPIINPGEAAILAVGAIKPRPWVVDGELAVRAICQLALSFDHRLVDGEQGSRFLADVGALLTDPGLALTW